MKFQNFLASKTVRISPGYSNVIRMCHRILTGSRAKYKLNEKKISRSERNRLIFYVPVNYSAGWIASVGQASAHVPQSKQASASITKCSSPWEIASAGHSLSHVPQLTHSSEITYAIIIILLIIISFLVPLRFWLYSNISLSELQA